MTNKELAELEGSVEEIIYKNEESGFCVLELHTPDTLVVVVGSLAAAQSGDDLKITGFYTDHSKYGRQFVAEYYERSFPKTAESIYKYLASGAVKGIGPVLARNIVNLFGEETLNIVERHPERLGEVKGISPNKAAALGVQFKQVFASRTLMLFLEQNGISPSHGALAWKKWGANSINYIKDNPYVLCGDDIMVPFPDADKVAINLELPPTDISRIKAGLVHVLRHNSKNGFTGLPAEQLITLTARLLEVNYDTVSSVIEACAAECLLYKVENPKEFLMLPEYYLAETYISQRLKTMLNRREEYENLDILIDTAQEEAGIVFDKKQRDAIKSAYKYDVMILTGGPGTGKTTVLNGIISLFEHQGLLIDIAAPTGRAAKRMAQVTGREAQTIHRLLGAGFQNNLFQKHEGEPLKSDVVIIDETSMVDSQLFASLLKAIKPGAGLILVGDHNQLPSVGPGNVLHDLIKSGTIPTIELKKIFRQSSKSLIVTNAHRIISGQMPDLSAKDKDFFFIDCKSGESAARTVIGLAAERLPAKYGYDPFEDIQTLTPSRKGTLGVIDLNHRLQKALNSNLMLNSDPDSGINTPSKNEFDSSGRPSVPSVKFGDYTFFEKDKVMQNCNNYDIEWTKDGEPGTGVFNGDIGVIQRIDARAHELTVNFENRISVYPFEKLQELELAYAVTVHKSQGNEFDAVIMPLPGGYEKLYFRQLLYTAVTRAKKILIIVGTAERVGQMVNNNRKILRYTGLRHFLN
ncbi:MAG: AAA family ATPase [Oscillospiraceae bacterium]|nr:AAA family ATPase [Oscillospiraceae bacterium]